MLDHTTIALTQNLTRLQNALQVIDHMDDKVLISVGDSTVCVEVTILGNLLREQFDEDLEKLNETHSKS